MKKITKFKKGDKVRVLPSAIRMGVYGGEVGKTGIIVGRDCFDYLRVYMDKLSTIGNHTEKRTWSVNWDDIEPVVKVGQQLVFDFMEKI